MFYSQKKLPKTAGGRLHGVSVASIRPYAFLYVPVYVFLKKNEKYLSIKGPFDFFTKEELHKLEDQGVFYLPKYIHAVSSIQKHAARIRDLLTNNQNSILKTKYDLSFEIKYTRSPFETSNYLIKSLGPLWWKYASHPEQPAEIGVEPFSVLVFVNEVCEALSEDLLLRSREVGSKRFDQALLRSSWIVFLALHLGYGDYSFINELRTMTLKQELFNEPYYNLPPELSELVQLDDLYTEAQSLKPVTESFFSKHDSRAAQKIGYRLEIIRDGYISKGSQPPTVFGPGGFIDE